MASKVAKMEVVCVEREEINTIEYFAEQLGVKKFYNIKTVLNTSRTCGGCHFCTPDYAADNPGYVNTPEVKKKSGYKVLCQESGEEWPSIKAAAEEKGFNYNAFYRYLGKVDCGEKLDFEGSHFVVIEDCREKAF